MELSAVTRTQHEPRAARRRSRWPSGSPRLEPRPRWTVTAGIVGQVYLRSPPGSDRTRLTPRSRAIDNESGFSNPMARKRSDDKRRRILQAAVKVFARKGYFAARVAEIAQRAGVDG